MVVNFKKIVVKTENITNCDDLVDLIMYSIGKHSIVNYVISENEIIFYVEVTSTESNDEMEIESDIIIKQFDVINEYVKKYGKKYPDYDSFSFDSGEWGYMKSAATFMKELVDYYIDKKIRIPLNEIEFIDGVAQIFKNDGTIIILADEYILSYDLNDYDFSDGTISIIRTDNFNVKYLDDNINLEEFDIDSFNIDMEAFNIELDKLRKISDEHHYKEHQKNIKDMKNLISIFDENENISISTSGSIAMSAQEIEIEQMQTFIDSVKDDGQQRILSSTGAIELKSATYAEELETVVDEEISTEELDSFTKGYRTTTTIVANVETISFDKFDDMAKKYHIVEWDLSTPTTLSIKFIEGITPESTVKKFHDMMDSLDSGLVNTTQFNHLKDLEESVEFFVKLRNIVNDNTDIAKEFINRVKKHNVFVNESMAKIRTALIDMENDFERSLQNEVNLSIDWDKLTAFATKKELTLHRAKGVEMVFNRPKGSDANIVRVNSDFEGKEFYIPFNLITDEIREKYVLDNDLLYIEDVPEFAFYELYLNGHVLLIEKTDL